MCMSEYCEGTCQLAIGAFACACACEHERQCTRKSTYNAGTGTSKGKGMGEGKDICQRPRECKCKCEGRIKYVHVNINVYAHVPACICKCNCIQESEAEHVHVQIDTVNACKSGIGMYDGLLCFPEGPSTRCLRSLVPKTRTFMVLGTKVLTYWVLEPSGLGELPASSRAPIESANRWPSLKTSGISLVAYPKRSKHPNPKALRTHTLRVLEPRDHIRLALGLF